MPSPEQEMISWSLVWGMNLALKIFARCPEHSPQSGKSPPSSGKLEPRGSVSKNISDTFQTIRLVECCLTNFSSQRTSDREVECSSQGGKTEVSMLSVDHDLLLPSPPSGAKYIPQEL
ncbi:hypothetical protein EYF80_028873 [Liparis tanakae]|uniref:Uncharacterized protein n=1 Tax=Liparis tanakae TaxID=230148 RepID=A0A4Z2H4U3_9TELE|nr:hypothetical protein EYF80_028873 [Liparis tanakae]